MSEIAHFNLKNVEDVQKLLNVFKDVIPANLESELKKAIKKGEIPEQLGLQIKDIVQNYQEKIMSKELLPDEEVLWVHEVKKGILKRETVEKWIITNHRIMKLNFEKNQAFKIGVLVTDVVVMNKRRESSGSRVGTFTGRGGRGFVGVGVSSSSSKSMTYGDLVFLVAGKEIFRFYGVSDPDGIKRLIDNLKKATKV